jgi:hypothetical protein
MKNYYSFSGDTCHIELNNDKATMISIEDFEKVNEFDGTWFAKYDKRKDKWYVCGNFKVGKGKYKQVKLHRYIMDTPKDMLTDHINGNTFDNRRHNLRNVTHKENNQNHQGLVSSNTSGYAGVTWYERDKKWQAQISLDDKMKLIGRFDTKEAAYEAYKAAKGEYHKASFFARIKKL